MARCPKAETRAQPGMPHRAPKCLQQEPIQCPLCLPWGGGAECQCLARGLPGASLQLMKVTRSSRGAAGQNWPLSPQPDATTWHTPAVVQVGLTATRGIAPQRHRGGPSRRAQRGLGSQVGARSLWKGYRGTRSSSGLEAVGKWSHVMTGNLVFLYKVRGGAEQG